MTLFEVCLKEKVSGHKYTPRHNGKVERAHRKDNNFPMHPLHWQSPRKVINNLLQTGEVDDIKNV